MPNKVYAPCPTNGLPGSDHLSSIYVTCRTRRGARQASSCELLQRGEAPSDFKPINIVGKGTQEIRIRTEDASRVFYVARFEEAVYVLHAFQKKTQQTSRKDVALGQQRYREMLQLRQQQGRDIS